MDDPRRYEQSDDVTEHEKTQKSLPTGDKDDIDTESDENRSKMKRFTENTAGSASEDYKRQLTLMFKSLKTKCIEINCSIKERKSTLEVEDKYTKWKYFYHDFLETCDNYFKTLSPDEYTQYAYTDFELREEYLNNFKRGIEEWLTFAGPPMVSENDSASQDGEIDNSPIVHTVSRGAKSVISNTSQASRTSSLIMEKIKEEQKQAELNAKMTLLQKRRDLEMAKLDLKLREEESQIDTEMAVSDARSKVIIRHEQTELKQNDIKDESHLLNYESKFSEYKAYGPADNSQKSPLLNPQAVTFFPKSGNVGNYLPQTHRNSENSDNLSCTQIQSHKNDTYVDPYLSTGVKQGSREYKPVMHDHNMYNVPHNTSSGNSPTVVHTDMNYGSAYGNRPNVSHGNHMYNPNPILTGTEQPISHDFATSMVKHMRLPISEIKRFGGNCMEYKSFIRQFHSKIILNTDNDEEKINFLQQYTIGEANKLVSGFTNLDGCYAFPAAMRALDDRYGDDQVIANAYINKALDWNPMKADDSKSLDEFAMFLVECENAANSIEALRVLEYSENIKRVIGKLPYFLHDRWRSIVMQKKERKQIVDFADLVRFVNNESKKANHPVYGKEALRTGQLRRKDAYSNPPGGHVSKVKSSFATCELKPESPVVEKVEISNKRDTNKTREYEFLKVARIAIPRHII